MDHVDAWVVFGVIAFLVITLYTEWVRPAISFMIAVVALLLAKIITPAQALEGFANEQLAVIVLLLIIGSMFAKTRVLQHLFSGIFKRGLSTRSFLMRMMAGVGISSAFLNNTPLVAMFMPLVHAWSKDNDKAPSRFLIPLSYASILGGCVTLIGTSTNLIANGLAIEAGEQGLGIFDFAWVGGAMLVIGFLFLLFFSQRLLPENTSNTDRLKDAKREYFIETIVKSGSKLIGKSIEDAGLRNLKGLFIVEIVRGDKFILPVAPSEVLEEGDTLLFAGDPESISDLTRPGLGLSLPKNCVLPQQEKTDVVELVIAGNSRLVGRKVMESDFRGRYDGAILAIRRDGERLSGKIGEITLKAGDLLLVLAGNDFEARTQSNPGFYVLSRPTTVHNIDMPKTLFLLLGFVASIVLSAFNVVPLMVSLAVMLVLGLFLKLTHPPEIRNSIDFNLVFIIAAGLALGKGMINSGAADMLAGAFSQMSGSVGVIGLMTCIFLITNIFSAFMTSKAAVALVMPIASDLGP